MQSGHSSSAHSLDQVLAFAGTATGAGTARRSPDTSTRGAALHPVLGGGRGGPPSPRRNSFDDSYEDGLDVDVSVEELPPRCVPSPSPRPLSEPYLMFSDASTLRRHTVLRNPPPPRLPSPLARARTGAAAGPRRGQ